MDTNVVVRLVVSDDAEQTRRARKLVEQALTRDEPVLVSLLVLPGSGMGTAQSLWIQSRVPSRHFPRTAWSLRLSFEDEPALEEALFRKDSACEFSDCLIVAHNRKLGCRATATFDGKAARLPRYRTGLVCTV